MQKIFVDVIAVMFVVRYEISVSVRFHFDMARNKIFLEIIRAESRYWRKQVMVGRKQSIFSRNFWHYLIDNNCYLLAILWYNMFTFKCSYLRNGLVENWKSCKHRTQPPFQKFKNSTSEPNWERGSQIYFENKSDVSTTHWSIEAYLGVCPSLCLREKI